MSGSPELHNQAYEEWSPAASWQAAEERSRAGARIPLRVPQRAREPRVALPTFSRRHVRYAAVAALGLVALFAGRALASRAHALWTSWHRVKASAVVPSRPKTFAWVPVPGARSYVVEFAQRGRVVYRTTTRQPRLRVAARWTFRSRRYAFRPGVYHWHVWPILRTAKGSHRGPATVDSTLTIGG